MLITNSHITLEIVELFGYPKHLQPLGEYPRHQPVDVVLVIHQRDYMFFADHLQVRLLLHTHRAVRARPPVT